MKQRIPNRKHNLDQKNAKSKTEKVVIFFFLQSIYQQNKG